MTALVRASRSVRKSEVATQKTPMIAFKAFSFAHQATAGQTTINLLSLTTPSSMNSMGFVQPSLSDLTAARLGACRRNLQLFSSLRGPLHDYDAYTIGGNSSINLSFSAEDGEIFIGRISDVAKTGLQVLDGEQIIATGELAAGTTDFAVGQPFTYMKNPATQIGEILVFLDGALQMRNVANATAAATADGNFQEIDAGGNLCNTIRFNVTDSSRARPVVVISNGIVAVRPTESQMALIETLAGQVDAVIDTLAAIAGVPTTNFQAAPNSVDLRTFANRVLALEQRLATAAQSGFVSHESTGSFGITISGGFVTNPTGSIVYDRIGKVVFLAIPTIVGTSNGTTQMVVSSLPSFLTPTRNQAFVGAIFNGGTSILGYIQVRNDGTLLLNRFAAVDNITGGTTGSSTKGLAEQTLVYILD